MLRPTMACGEGESLEVCTVLFPWRTHWPAAHDKSNHEAAEDTAEAGAADNDVNIIK